MNNELIYATAFMGSLSLILLILLIRQGFLNAKLIKEELSYKVGNYPYCSKAMAKQYYILDSEKETERIILKIRNADGLVCYYGPAADYFNDPKNA